MDFRNGLLRLSGVGLSIVLLLAIFAISPAPASGDKISPPGLTLAPEGNPYSGTLKIYVVEPSSRWRNSQHNNFAHGFLSFAFDSSLNLAYQETFDRTVTWNSSSQGFGSISQSNIEVVAAVFNSEGYAMNSDTIGTSHYPFTAHSADAAAGALPGETGYNEVNANYTHTVFLEVGSTTW